eukprot:TRINITY_DN1169_c1_g4_i2.p1 TRINITY_DN1169_c1_g4~~TRINITY_DN1169_c1_g4_i2.p1  ORF type:complete len:590 (+),score=195.23 TRINITY_DN1169_c1_g4_i2:125-1894(+)
MARNEEKRNSMLSRFLQLSEPEKRAEKRPHLASLCEDLPSALKFRTQILREVGKKAFEIQNAGLGEGRIRELNDDINKLLREKYHWERRIIGLGGPDYTRVSQKFLEGDGRAIRGKGGYRYFGAAKDLPGVREKLQSEESGGSMADWEHIFRRIDMEYFGLHGEFIDEEEDDEGEGEEMSEEEDDDDDEHRVANRILRGRKRRHKMDPRAKRKSAARKDQDILSSEPFSPLPVVLSASSAHEDEENEENEGRNDMNVEVEGTAEIESESRRHTGGKRPRHSLPPEMIQLNFGILDPSLKKIRDPSEILRKQNSLDEQIRDAQLRRDKLNPNLKSDANFRLASERVVSSKNEIDQARREEREATGRFDDIREKRVQTYMECFDAVAQRIDAVYKRLTQEDVASMSRREDGESEQSSSPRNAHHDAPDGGSRVEEGEEDEDDRIISGGTAFLGLEMPDEPYLGGVKYNCTPPGKRADSHLSARSGGERTMSALALLFALHSIHPSPFFVFDEVDAALDKVNVQKVARYIETLSRKRKTQCIVISHKEGLFDHADVLFGVTRDAKTPSQSVVLSLDLRKYDARHHQQPHTRS